MTDNPLNYTIKLLDTELKLLRSEQAQALELEDRARISMKAQQARRILLDDKINSIQLALDDLKSRR